MDRLFKKRTNSVKDPRRAPSRQNSADEAMPTASSSKLSIRTTGSTKRSQKGRAKLDNASVTSPVTPGSGSSAGLPSSTLAAPPSLDMDFRHSLLLPGLSQRFSVLLPSLSSIPESSLRPLLASQRQRNDLGPAITEEEEEMIFAELQDLAQTQKKKLEQWAEAPADNPVWSTMNLARWEHGANIPSAPTFSPQSRNSALSGSSSTPNLLHEATSAPLSIIGEQLALSSPPTSTSFDSLSTVGSNGSGGKEKRDERAMARSRGYGGFGGGARMQEDAYLRRSRKESERNLSTSMSSRSISGISQASSDRTERTDDTNRTEKGKDKAQEPEAQHRLERKAKGLSPISPELANADWKRKPSANSPTASERTATPTSAVPGPSGRRKITRHSPASSLSLNLPPQPPVPTSPPPEPPQSDAARQTVSAMATGRAPKQRKSMLSVLSDAQLKRISLALFEIGKELEAMGIKTTDDTDEEGEATSGTKAQGKEEILESVGDAGEPRDMDNERERIDSFKSQSESGHSTGSSSVFPYHVSPTTSSFATVPCDTTGAGARIPASPKVLDLHAQISHPKPMDPLPPPEEPPLLRKQSVIIQEGARPKPILTPTRTLPAKHVPSDSFDGSTPASALAIPGYIPGQMRPVGSAKSDSSSRSGTPNATSSIVPQDHTPIPALRQMTVSPLLARSQSVQTGSARQTPTAQHQRNVSLGQPITDSWRSASPLAQMSRTSAADIEEEDELPDAEQVSGDVSPRVPSDEEDIVVQQVVGKHSVARSRSDAKQRQKAQVKTDTPMSEIGETSSTPSLLDVPNETRARVTSHQAHIEGGSERSVARSSQARPSVQSICELAKGDDKPTTQPVSPRNSIGSSFHGKYEGENELDDYLQTPEMDPQEIEAVLGVSRETMEAMQDMLVMKAKAEREAFRAEMGDSPAMVMSPSMSASDLPAVPVQMRTMSPLAPAVARAITPVHRESEASRASGEVQAQGVQAEGTRSADLDFKPAPTMSTPPAPASVPVLPSAPVPGERSASGSQSIASASVPPSIPASRKPSHSSKVAPEDDPDVVRDFEARIAAATAALQRQPSVSGPSTKLERKGTKRGAMKISSPTLVSSSSSISGAILSPPLSGPGAATPPSSFKPAKPAHKMSLKWKNAFKRGPSISSSDKDKGVANPAVFSPPAYDSAPTSRNVSATSAVTTASSQTSTSGAVQQGTRQSEGSAKTPQRSLGDFRFPSSEQAPMSAGVSAAEPAVVPSISSGSVRSVLGRMKRGKSDEAPLALDRGVSPASTMIGSAGHASHADHRPPPQATASAPAVQQLKQAEASSSTSHRSNPSDDSAVAKFIAAGRALGLDNEQMNEMLAAKGMLNRSGSSRSNGSAALTGGSTASHTSPSPVTPATGIVVSPLVQSHDQPAATDVVSTPTYPDRQREGKERNDMPLTKKEGLAGLVRALSKKRAPKTDSEKEERHKVVRRTILMPESTSFNTLPRDSFASPQRSPRSQVSFSAQQPDSPAAPSFERTRNNSIRRKPIAMTPEEEEMLSASGSPVAPGRRVSMGNTSNPGLGFLAPESAERRPSGASGQSGQSGQSGLSGHESVYDMYGNESMAQSQQGIEIKEYEDGRIVWNVLDGLRGDEESESDYTQSGDFSQSQFQPHSREASFASDRSVDVGNKALSKEYKLPLRHRDRGANEPRPQTNLYFTSPTDVADLIDQLSQDPSASGKGRIDFTLPSPPPVPDLPAFTAHRTPPLAGKASNTGQFEDAPSPNRRTPPAPINVNRANQAPAGGWSPQRQARLRQAFGRAPAPTSSGVKAQQYVTPPGSTTPNSATSPGADSMNSLGSPAPGQGQSARNVEDRLQALMDRLVKSGAVRQG